MAKKRKTIAPARQLRRRAEARLQAQRKTPRLRDGSPASAADSQRLVQELQVHKIELEMQNEELSQATAQAEASAERFSDLYDFAPVGFLTLDPKGTIRQINLSGARLLGLGRARLLNRRLGQFVAGSDRLAFSDFLLEVFASRAKKHCEVRLPRGDSQPLVVQIECTRSADGQECRAVVFEITRRKQTEEALQQAHNELELRVAARTEALRKANQELRAEITERKQAEEALKTSQRLLAETGRMGKIGGWEIDTDTAKLIWTEEIYLIHEVDLNYRPTVEKGIGFYTPASRPIIQRAVQRAIRHGEPFDLELEITTAKGNLRSVHARGKADREHRRVYGSFQDITERKKAEAALRLSEERFRHVAETAGEFIWEVNAVGLYTFASPSVEKTLGYTPQELVGKKHFYDLFDPSVREELKAEAFRAFAARQPFRDFPNANISKSGQVVHLETTGTPVLDSAGNLSGYLGIDTDVTGRKRAALEIVQQRHELAHIARVSTLGQLASSLAHELNQPLGAILRNAEVAELFLQEPSPDLDEVRAILADIRKDDQRAGAVIDRVRALMKRRTVERCPLDFNLLAGEVVTLVRLDAEMRRVRLALETDPGLPHVQGDRVQLQQVVLNLLLNAMDAVNDNPPAKRNVALRARPAGAAVEVTVSDNGHGIAADHLPRVFEPFFTSKPHGLGMGLAISRSIVEQHGGRLCAENSPGGGAAFTFTLPAAQAAVFTDD